MTFDNTPRVDKAPDPFANVDSRLRSPKRMESNRVIGANETQRRMAAHVTGIFFGNQAITNNTPTVVGPYGGLEFDTAGIWAGTKLIIPSSGLITGLWLIHGVISWEANAVGRRSVSIYRNGSNIAQIEESPGTVGGSFEQEITRYYLDPRPGDYFELAAYQTSGGNLNVINNTDRTYFELIHIW